MRRSWRRTGSHYTVGAGKGNHIGDVKSDVNFRKAQVKKVGVFSLAFGGRKKQIGPGRGELHRATRRGMMRRLRIALLLRGKAEAN